LPYHTLKPLKKTIKLILSIVIFVSFIAIIEHFIGWAELLAPWQALSVNHLLMATLGILLSYLIRTLRLYDYFLQQMTRKFLLTLRLTLQHNCLLHLLPFRSGEISYPVLMKRYFAIPYGQSIPSLLWFRFLDLHTLGIFGLIYLGFTQLLPIYILWIISGLWCMIPWLLYKYANTCITYIIEFSPASLHRYVADFNSGLPQSSPAMLRSWFWTLLNWTIKLQIFAWILTLFIDVPFIVALVGAITGDLSSILPIHGLAGMGTFEMGVLAGLMLADITWQDALLAGFNLHLFILGTAILTGLLSFSIQSKTTQQAAKNGSRPTHFD